MESQDIRNVALVGHSGSGKTSIAEALLFASGATTRLGRVEDGNTVTDFEPEEIERQVSIGLALAPVTWNGRKINVIDTPGYADFVGDLRSALRAADLALFVVSAVDGVEVQTEVAWQLAAEEGISRAIFINKLDRERSDFTAVLAQLKEYFGTGVAPVEMPIGSEHELRGVAGIVSNHAFLYDPDSPVGHEADIPDELKEAVTQVHTALVEAVVENDEELLEAYFDGKEPTTEQLASGLRAGVADGSIFPVLCGSATKLVGIDRLAELIVRDGPTPLDRPMPPLQSGDGLAAGATGSTAGYVFKTLSDPYVGRISMFRLFAGSLRLDETLENARAGSSGRMHNLFFVRGKEHSDAKEVACGDIAAVAKLETVISGDTLRAPGTDVVIAPVTVPRPTMSLAVSPLTSQDEEKLSTALRKTAEDDATLVVERRAETNQTVLSGLGDTHLDVAVARLSRRYGVEVQTGLPKIPYRETIIGRADVEGKHKKQSGGRGQFGVAYVRFEPLPAGQGYEFVNEVKGGSIPRQLIPAVDKGIREALGRGLLAGYPVVDIKATVYDGKDHPVDSDELSFRMAGIQAVRAAAAGLSPVLLEPIMSVRVIAPEDTMGDIIGDLNAKRGRVGGMDSIGRMRVVTADVPLAEMRSYTIDLRSITGGRGTFEMDFARYEQAPPQETQKVIAAAQAEED